MAHSSFQLRQYVAGFCANILTVSYGAFCAWPSSSFLELQSVQSPLESGPLSNNDAGTVAAMLCLGGIFGTCLGTWCSDTLGRKKGLLISAIPMLLAWVIIPYAKNPLHLNASRFLGGLSGGGIFVIVPIYSFEIASDELRGSLGTLLILACNFGVFTSFFLGYFFNYAQVAWIMSIPVLVFMGMFVCFPDTPQYLVTKQRIDDATRAIQYYKNLNQPNKNELLQIELERLNSPDSDTPSVQEEKILPWKEIKQKHARKAFLIGFFLMALNIFCGAFAMLQQSATIFNQSDAHVSPKLASIIVGVILIVGTMVSTIFVEKSGRKLLLLISTFGTIFGHVSFGSYAMISSWGYQLNNVGWIPVASFSLTIFMACVGVLGLPFVIISEIFPPKIGATGRMICMLVNWLFLLALLKIQPILNDFLGLHGISFFYACCCMSGAIFIILKLPETKGKRIENILNLL